MAKKAPFDIMKFIPLGVMAVSLVSGYTLLQSRVSNAEDKLKSYEIVQTKLASDSTDIKISQVKTETQMQAVIEILKDIKGKL